MTGHDTVRAAPARGASEMRRIATSKGELSFKVDVSRPGEPAYFFLGVRKSGSTLLARMAKFLSDGTGHGYIEWPDEFFRKGLEVRHWRELDFAPILEHGNVYSGFRTFPDNVAETTVFREARKILLVRDPRDALVSQYFSDAFSHALPREDALSTEGRERFMEKREKALNQKIDDYVLEHAAAFAATLDQFRPMLDDANCLIFRYEAIIRRKRRMIEDMLAHLGWTIRDGATDELLDLVDKIPDVEDKTIFLRKALPGDHREKLAPRTIGELNAILGDVMAAFEYGPAKRADPSPAKVASTPEPASLAATDQSANQPPRGQSASGMTNGDLTMEPTAAGDDADLKTLELELGRILFRTDIEAESPKPDADAVTARWHQQKADYMRRSRQMLRRFEANGLKLVQAK